MLKNSLLSNLYFKFVSSCKQKDKNGIVIIKLPII